MAGLKTQVTCPNCGKSFAYEFIPGASLTAVRLGGRRYMRCPKCGKWGTFDITKNLPQRTKRHLLNSAIICGAVFLALAIALIVLGNGNVLLYAAGMISILISLLIIFTPSLFGRISKTAGFGRQDGKNRK